MTTRVLRSSLRGGGGAIPPPSAEKRKADSGTIGNNKKAKHTRAKIAKKWKPWTTHVTINRIKDSDELYILFECAGVGGAKHNAVECQFAIFTDDCNPGRQGPVLELSHFFRDPAVTKAGEGAAVLRLALLVLQSGRIFARDPTLVSLVRCLADPRLLFAVRGNDMNIDIMREYVEDLDWPVRENGQVARKGSDEDQEARRDSFFARAFRRYWCHKQWCLIEYVNRGDDLYALHLSNIFDLCSGTVSSPPMESVEISLNPVRFLSSFCNSEDEDG